MRNQKTQTDFYYNRGLLRLTVKTVKVGEEQERINRKRGRDKKRENLTKKENKAYKRRRNQGMKPESET